MEKVVVGISGNIKELPARSGLPYDVVSRSLSDGVKEAGGLPIVIPVASPDLAKDYIDMIDKLILSGGQNELLNFMVKENQLTVMIIAWNVINLS